MSYTRLGQIVLTNISSLRKAIIKNPKLTWVEGATSYQHEYNNRKCVHKIQVAGSGGYEIGVIDNPDGAGYKLIWDSSANFEPIIGQGACNISTDYARESAREWAAAEGYVIKETADSEGNIVLEMTN